MPYRIPEWLMAMPVHIERCDIDYGPATKLIPSLMSVDDPNERIVTVDDDIVYERHLLEELAEASEKHPDKVIGFEGFREGNRFIHAEHVRSPRGFEPVDVLEGYRGIIYRRGLFDGSIFTDIRGLMADGMFLCDDELFSWNLRRRGIKRVVTATKYRSGDLLNFKTMDLGGGVHDGPRDKINDSIRRIECFYEKNGFEAGVF